MTHRTRSASPLVPNSVAATPDKALMDEYCRRLTAYLDDPAFRSIPGFPMATKEAILALSDPPYYTACPNPFLSELLNALPGRNDDKHTEEPYAADIEEGKSDALYNVHGYHTKVPPRAVLRYLLHYSRPGDVILDGFCGSGMVGLAAHLAAHPAAILKREVDAEWRERGKSEPSWGQRHVVLADLSPAATFIANSYNDPNVFDTCIDEADAIVERVEQTHGWLYETTTGSRKGRIEYTIWSDVFVCPECGKEMVYWDVAVDKDNGVVRDVFPCPSCKTELGKRSLERAWTSNFDRTLKTTLKQPKQVPVVVNYALGSSSRYDKKPDRGDLDVLKRLEDVDARAWYPTDAFPDGEKTNEPIRLGLRHVHQMFTQRNLLVFAALWKAFPPRMRWLITGTLQRGSKQHQIAISRIGGPKKGVGGATAGHRRGTLYVPSNQVEVNVFALVRERIAAVRRARYRGGARPYISTGSATRLSLPDNSVDYVFIDPPFGANIMYGELSFMWEAWLCCFTRREDEAIQSKALGKTLADYQAVMRECFREYLRVLKPGRWMTVEFSNTKASVWNAIQTALEQAGFVVANVSTLSKGRGGLNAIVGKTAVNQDLAIACYKPKEGMARGNAACDSIRHELNLWPFVSGHLEYLPVFKQTEGRAVEVVERTARAIYDRVVAYCVGRAMSVPISSPDFQTEIAKRYPERDGMYFLPSQVGVYDRRRQQVQDSVQLELYVIDEASSIQWIRQELKQKPQTMQDLNPRFMKEIGTWQDYEEPRDLSQLLADNFLKYGGDGEVPSQVHAYLSSNYRELRGLGKSAPLLRERAAERWYVPDATKQSDLERLRERALLREFESYQTGGKRPLKTFRSEAIRSGFRAAYERQDYKLIVDVARRIPESVLQEDEQLLMYFDVASMRLGEQ